MRATSSLARPEVVTDSSEPSSLVSQSGAAREEVGAALAPAARAAARNQSGGRFRWRARQSQKARLRRTSATTAPVTVVMRLAVLVPAVLTVAATTPPSWHTFHSDGVSVRYPPGWHATAAAMTPVTYPPQVLAVASFPLPRDANGADGCEPKQALDRLPAAGAFLFGWEYATPSPFGKISTSDFAPRPPHFRLGHFAHYECLGPSYLVRFRQAERYFQIHIAFGARATPAIRRTALEVLDSFSAKPR
jgi:hypothetical protein